MINCLGFDVNFGFHPIMNHVLTLSAGPLNCQLRFGDDIIEKTVQERYEEFIIDEPSDNVLKIIPSSSLVPEEKEFDLQLRNTEKGVCFFSSSTDGYFDTVSRSGLLNIASSRLDNPATIENALRYLFGILALNRGYIFIHGAACISQDRAWLFLGPSGSGKSTISSFARKHGYGVLSDDFILLGGNSYVFSTPFFGQVKTMTKREESFPVKGIIIIHKDDNDSLSPIDSTSAKVAHLLSNVPFAEFCDTQTLNRILGIVERIGGNIAMYRMQFTNSPKFLDLLQHECAR